jgi:hypothetical protein
MATIFTAFFVALTFIRVPPKRSKVLWNTVWEHTKNLFRTKYGNLRKYFRTFPLILSYIEFLKFFHGVPEIIFCSVGDRDNWNAKGGCCEISQSAPWNLVVIVTFYRKPYKLTRRQRKPVVKGSSCKKQNRVFHHAIERSIFLPPSPQNDCFSLHLTSWRRATKNDV